MRKTLKIIMMSLMIFLFLNIRHVFASTILSEIRIEVGTANYKLSVWDFASPGDSISYQISLLNDVNQIMNTNYGITIPANQILTVGRRHHRPWRLRNLRQPGRRVGRNQQRRR